MRNASFLRDILFGVASGVLLALSLPKPDLYPLAWFALVPAWLVFASPISVRRAAAAGYAFGVAYYAGTCYWMTDTMLTYGGLSLLPAFGVTATFCLSHALYFALFGVGVATFVRRFGTFGLALAPPLWVAMELARGYFPLGGFPWMLSGYALVPYAGALQIVTWTGVFGLSFIVAAVNTALVYAALRKDWRPALVAIIAIAAVWIWPAPGESAEGSPLNVRMVQANISLNQSWDDVETIQLLDQLRALSLQAGAADVAGAPRLLVWPETPAPFSLSQDPVFRRRVESIAVSSQSYFLLNNLDTIGSAPANSAALLDPAGKVVSRYDKIRLVPFGEYVPMKDLLFFAGKLVEQVGDFAPGVQYTISPIGGHRLATIICYESIFPDFARQFVRDGAELLVVITNDAWFGSSSAPFQHLRMGVVRAVENRRYLVRVANTGVTVIIDPYGRIVSRAPREERVVVDGVARFRSDRTFYSQYGDVFAFANVAAVLLLGGVAFARHRARFT
jgi:apolipoprotein N-acyltransferase